MKSKAPTGALQTVTTNGVVKVSAHLWFKAHSCSLDLYANRYAPFKHHCPHAAYVCVCCVDMQHIRWLTEVDSAESSVLP